MKIECLEEKGVKHHPYYLSLGDVVTVPDEVGQYLVSMGWCKNVETGEVGQRQTQSVNLNINNASHTTKSPEV